MYASAYRSRDFTIVLVFPPLSLFKTYFFIYYSRDDLLGRRSRDYIFQKRKLDMKRAVEEGKSRGELVSNGKYYITETNENILFLNETLYGVFFICDSR